MIRGTTPTHTFRLPIDVSEITNVRILYAQNDKVIFKKELTDCELGEDSIIVQLSQEDTLKFKHDVPVQIQLRVLTIEGEVTATKVRTVTVDKCLDNEVLT